MLPSDLAALLADFHEDHGRPPAVVVVHPRTWDDLCGWTGTGSAFARTCRGGLTVEGVPVRRSHDVEEGRAELY